MRRPVGVICWGVQAGRGEDGDGGLADGFEAGEAVGDLGAELGFGVFGGVGEGEGEGDAVFLGDSGDVGAGGFGVRLDGEGADEAEVDDVAGEFGVVAVAEGLEDVGFGEHCWFDDKCGVSSGTNDETVQLLRLSDGFSELV